MARGERVRPNDSALIELHNGLFNAALPQLETELRGTLVRRFLEASELRYQRLAESGSFFPRTVWIPMLGTPILALATTFFVIIPSLRVQLTLSAIISVAFAILLYIIMQLDYPFTGPTAISPKPFLDALAIMRGG
jgi:hypothetical protein